MWKALGLFVTTTAGIFNKKGSNPTSKQQDRIDREAAEERKKERARQREAERKRNS